MGAGGLSGFFIPGSPKLLRFQAHHEHILGRALPKLKRHMVSSSVPPEMWSPWQGGGPTPAGFTFLLLGGPGGPQKGGFG